jgi:hypothetical protein
MVRGSNPVVGEIFHTCPDRFWVPPSLLFNWYRGFPMGKTAGACRWPPTWSSTEVKERVSLYLYFPLSLRGLFWTFNFTFTRGRQVVQKFRIELRILILDNALPNIVACMSWRPGFVRRWYKLKFDTWALWYIIDCHVSQMGNRASFWLCRR